MSKSKKNVPAPAPKQNNGLKSVVMMIAVVAIVSLAVAAAMAPQVEKDEA